jgi:penicillin-insensitive murein DD-endopeptidase
MRGFRLHREPVHNPLVRLALMLVAAALGGCAELGVVSDGTSISMGRPHRGWIVDGVRIPDKGEGFVTREVWRARGQRYGTDELVDLLTAVSRRMATRFKERIVIADLSGKGGGPARAWHASHQSGRDVDVVYYVRDKDGKPVEPDRMRMFDKDGNAKDGSGHTVDVPRMWLLAKELLTAPEAPVQWLFIYQPLAERIIEHAIAKNEPEALIVKAKRALKQPGNGAPHMDHMHVRVYCSKQDKAYGCLDHGPMDLAARDAAGEAELATVGRRVRSAGIR